MKKLFNDNRILNEQSAHDRKNTCLWFFALIFLIHGVFLLSQSMVIFRYVGVAILMVILLVEPQDNYIYFFLALLPANLYASIYIGSFHMSVLNFITIVYFIRKFMGDLGGKIKIDSELVVPCIVFLIFHAQFLVLRVSSMKLFFLVIKQFFMFYFFVDTFINFKNKKDSDRYIDFLSMFYSVGVMLSVFAAYIFNSSYVLNVRRLSLTKNSGANSLGSLVAFAVTLMVLVMLKTKERKQKIYIGCVLAIVAYFGFATQSRTCFFGMVIAAVGAIAFGISQKKTRKASIILVIIIVILVAVVIIAGENVKLFANIYGTIDRIINPKNDDITNGRVETWAEYLEVLKNDSVVFLFGNGGKIVDKMAHNMYIEILISYGLFGTFIVIWIYYSISLLIRRKYRQVGYEKISIMGLIPFGLVFLMGMSGHALLSSVSTANYCLGYIFTIAYNNYKEDSGEDENEDSLDNLNEGEPQQLGRYQKNKHLRRMGIGNH